MCSKNIEISYNVIYVIMKKKMVTSSMTKSHMHKLIRYKRIYSNAMQHPDCMK